MLHRDPLARPAAATLFLEFSKPIPSTPGARINQGTAGTGRAERREPRRANSLADRLVDPDVAMVVPENFDQREEVLNRRQGITYILFH
jgi:hypothetical protein